MTGGMSRGNRVLMLPTQTYEAANPGIRYPTIDSGPALLYGNIDQRLINCASASPGPAVAPVILQDITQFNFAQFAFPICKLPPLANYLFIVPTADVPLIQRCLSPSSTAQTPTNGTDPCIAFTASYNFTKNAISSSIVSSGDGVFRLPFQVVYLDYSYRLVAVPPNQPLTVSPVIDFVFPDTDVNCASVAQLGNANRPLLASSYANYTDYGMRARPGTTVYLHFSVNLPDGRIIQSNTMSVTFQSCQPGSVIDSYSCKPCPDDYTSYTMNADTCYLVNHTFADSATATLITIIGVCLFLVVIAMIFIAIHSKNRMIIAYSPLFCVLSLFGVACILISTILMSLQPTSDRCTASVFLFNVGFTIAFGCVWSKTYRLWRIFGNPLLHMISISNTLLFGIVVAFLAIDLIILIVWASVNGYRRDVGKYTSCMSDHSDVYVAILIGWKGVLVLSSAYLTYQVRFIPSNYNESRNLSIAIYNVALLAAHPRRQQ